jgi:hypothetical protein
MDQGDELIKLYGATFLNNLCSNLLTMGRHAVQSGKTNVNMAVVAHGDDVFLVIGTTKHSNVLTALQVPCDPSCN